MTVQEYINELEKIEDKSKELDSPLPSIIGTVLYILGIILVLGGMMWYAFLNSIIFGIAMLGMLLLFLGIIIKSLSIE